MDVEFASNDLALVETDRAADTGLPVAVIQATRQRVTLLRAAPDLATLIQWRSFGYREPLDERGAHAVTILERWHMAVRIEPTPTQLKATVIEISQELRGAA